jgi:hypothetical protein
MKTIIVATLIGVACAGVLMVGCKSDQTSVAQGKAGFSGTIKDKNTSLPLPGATITARSVSETSSGSSDQNGNFALDPFTTDSTVNVLVSASKSGYNDTTFTITLFSGVPTAATIFMTPKSVIVPPGGTSGVAKTIAFLGANPQELRVYGVGGQETSILSWEVRDSLGLPIDASRSLTLNFLVVGGPVGGEYVSPASVLTNNVGRAYTTFNSGVKAGVAQVYASTVNSSGDSLYSRPVRVVMDGGFPVQSHFSISATIQNFPALHWQNRRDAIQVLLGDIYSNPVAPNTAVYFHTSPYPPGEIGGAGVVQPTVYTDVDGLGGVNLISGSPQPLGAYAYTGPIVPSGNGYHYVVARTIGRYGESVMDSIKILWTGYPFITNLNPPAFNIANGGFLDFTFTVADELGHPLAAGTVINVIAQVPPPPDPNSPVNQVQVGFGINGSVTLPDVITAGGGTTNFSFRLSDGTSNLNQVTAVLMTIAVSGPNGSAIQFINGTVN